jgi:peptide/nickel transport system permease protein
MSAGYAAGEVTDFLVSGAGTGAAAPVVPTIRRRRNVLLWLSIGWIVLVVLAAVLAPVLPLDHYDAPVGFPRSGPSAEHWLGLDVQGRDVLSRLIWGARVSLLIGVIAGAIATSAGSPTR